MALSEHEQRLLDEMERNLYQSDADTVAPGEHHGAPSVPSVVVGILIAVVGLAGAVAAVAGDIPLLGVLGFVAMVIGILLTLRRRPLPVAPNSSTKRSRGGSPIMDGFEQRWERRQDGRD